MDGLIILFSFFLIRTCKLKFRLAVLNFLGKSETGLFLICS